MKILIACEESQEVCKAFRARGHEAYSCDIQPCSGGHPEWHIQDDVLKHLDDGWDMMIAHPPCTYLSNAGCAWLFKGKKLNQSRYEKGLQAKEFLSKLLNANIPKIAVENPIPHKVFKLPAESQRIQPFQFGHPVQKTTLLWLRNLPKLRSTNSIMCEIVPEFMRDNKGVRHSKWFMEKHSFDRSKTFHGIALAMAEQWG